MVGIYPHKRKRLGGGNPPNHKHIITCFFQKVKSVSVQVPHFEAVILIFLIYYPIAQYHYKKLKKVVLLWYAVYVVQAFLRSQHIFPELPKQADV